MRDDNVKYTICQSHYFQELDMEIKKRKNTNFHDLNAKRQAVFANILKNLESSFRGNTSSTLVLIP